MIGPSSGATSEMSNRDISENSVRLKRRTFEDLDIDNFCDEICHNTKKRNTMEQDPLEIALADIVHTSSTSSSSSSSQLPSVTSSTEETLVDIDRLGGDGGVVGGNSDSNGVAAAVARLEVLVVDGSWDVTNFGESDLIDLSAGTTEESSIENMTNVDNIENNYSTILSYWEPSSTLLAVNNNSAEQCTNIIENLEPPQSNACVVPTAIPPNQQDDYEHGNLSWLLDFKLDSLIEAPEEKNNISCACHNQTVFKSRQQLNPRSDNSISYLNSTTASGSIDNNNDTAQREKPINSNYALADNRNFSANHYNGPKKPPFTYTELIEHALQERGELTVSAIYQWISEHFPYYKSNDDRWKNSVRHNLSINPHFRKGSKAPHGAGHLWAIANRNETRPRQLIANLPGISTTQRPQVVKSITENNYSRKNTNSNRPTVTIDEVAAATASISENTEENILTSVTLEHCAEQILTGIKKEVEVQYLLPMAVQNECELESNQQIDQNVQTCDDKDAERDCWNVLADFLNPVAKEVVAEECGLIGEGYLVTDINPTTLGLNIVEPEITTPDHLFGEELSFQFYELASPSQLQSA